MVTDIFARWGIFRFIRGYRNRQRFKKALTQCERLNRESRRQSIVVRFDNRPLIIDKMKFKELKRQGVFRRDVSWGAMLRVQITRENL